MLRRSKRYPATWTSLAVRELFQNGSKADQVPNTTNSKVSTPVSSSTNTDSNIPKPINSSTPSPHLSSAAIAGIAISVPLLCALCAITTFSIGKRIKKNRTKPSIISSELPTTERADELPTIIEPVELVNHRNDRTELANSEISELFQISRQERFELP